VTFEDNGRYAASGVAAIAVLIGFACMAVALTAATYEESVSGDLTNNPAAPTPLTLSPSTNSIRGTLSSGPVADSLDIIVITVPAVLKLTGFTNSFYFGSDQPDFISLQTGASFLESVFDPAPPGRM
jgi:hypothetical protein